MYRAESLALEGFIHFSRWSQLAGTVQRYYAGVPDLVVLVVDENALDDLRIELSPSTGETFPHLYGELPVSRGHRGAPRSSRRWSEQQSA